MAEVLLKRIPKKTDMSNQQKVMREWSSTIVAKYSVGKEIPIINAQQYRQKCEIVSGKKK